MEKEFIIVAHEKNPSISMRLLPGHFATSSFHMTHYIDMSEMKTNALVARDVARELAFAYLSGTQIDTIICVERTAVIGAYLAEELLQGGLTTMNDGDNIHILAPLHNVDGKLIFHKSVIDWIADRNTVLIIPSTYSGRTLNRAIECIEYYHGRIIGISALFAAKPLNSGLEINALFTAEDIPDYRVFSTDQCEMCKAGEPLTALVSSEGYSEL